MYRILVVDDEENIRLLYERELRKEGYEVEVAANGEQALEKFRSSEPHLVVLDIKMPGMDGLEVMNRMLSMNNQLPIILNTAYASYKDNFTTWSADAYVVKSADLTQFKNKVEEILKEKYGEKARK
jgi:DNA-binding response OmpR family regulator